jgi:hypothetical protein
MRGSRLFHEGDRSKIDTWAVMVCRGEALAYEVLREGTAHIFQVIDF